ncbi:MAG: tripartite tricarboxylate transporter substrate-binding protein [Beijerinckiaceae bacterium]|nr:tripartite tricarboxylate transporter substrate-binding protein [Beijerinckiaceae bacterium]
MIAHRVAALGTMALVLLPGVAHAQAANEFYQGKTISFVVGAGAGGSYDIYARTLAAHMPKYIPGNPQIVVKMAGGSGGGISTAIQIEHTAPKDGTVFGMTQHTNVISQLTEPSVAGKYDVSRWRWVGNMANLRNVLAIWHTAPAQTLEDARAIEVIVGATGRNSPTFIVPQALNILAGTKFKMVLGYNGVADLNLAMERGEIQARGGSWISVVAQTPAYITEKKLTALVVDGLTRDPLLPTVPTLLELASTPDQKAAVRVISGANEFSRAVFLPPGTPQERIDMLRPAFDKAMVDPELIAQANKLKLPIEPTSGTELDKIAKEVVSSSSDSIALARKLLGE